MPAIAERLQQNILLKMRLRRPFLHPATRSIYLTGFWSCNAKHIERRKKRNRQAADRADRGLRREAFTIEKASGVEVLKELMDTNGLRQKDLADDLGGESIVSLILKESAS